MSLMYQSWTVANADFRGVSIRAGLGHYALVFSVRLSTPGNQDGAAYWLTNVHAKVHVSAPGKPPISVGHALTDLPIAIRAGQYPNPYDQSFEVRLSPQELQALEDVRNGGDLNFSIVLNGLAAKIGDEPVPAHDTVHGQAVHSEWIKQLNSSGFTNTLLLEVPLASLGSKKIAEPLHQARELLLAGRYADVVAKCRVVMETIDNVAPTGTTNVLESYQKLRDALPMPERLQLLRNFAKNFMHPAAHGDKKAVNTIYTRGDASMALAVAAALAAHADSASP